MAGGLTAEEPLELVVFLWRKIEFAPALGWLPWTIWLPLVRMSSMLWLRKRPVLRPSDPWSEMSTCSESCTERRLPLLRGWYIEMGPIESWRPCAPPVALRRSAFGTFLPFATWWLTVAESPAFCYW